MRRGRTELPRARQRRQQSRRGSTRRSWSNTTPEATPLRRSERLRSALLESNLASRSAEAEAIRAHQRISSRQRHISGESTEERDEPLPRRIHNSLNNNQETNNMHHTNTNGNPFEDGERSYMLELAYPLPTFVQINTLMTPPAAVRLRIRDTISGSEINVQDELSYLFVTISLCRESGEGLLPQNHEMHGITASLEPLNEGTQPHEVEGDQHDRTLDQQVGSFAHFSNFRIVRPGNYRMKFMLVRVEQPRHFSTGERGADRGGSRILATFIPPAIITAQENPVSPVYGL